jgi:beta-glucanase (GH16 family)
MQKLLFIAVLAGLCALGLAVAMPAGQTPAGTAAAAPAARPGWKLVWADEFDAPGLPDPGKWAYEEGFVRNHEAQFYTRGRPENARVEGGVLILEARKEKFPRPGGKAGETVEYTSASLTTRGKASWQYGRMEMRAKLPQGRGLWPAFWTLGDKRGWPAGGEIDIMEFVGHTPDRVHATLHWSGNGKHASSGGKLTVERPWDDFHIYAVEWTADRMDFTFDETKYFSYDVSKADDKGDNCFRQPHHLKLNLALGGSWGGKIDDTVLPQKYVIDYVRVYQRPEAR